MHWTDDTRWWKELPPLAANRSLVMFIRPIVAAPRPHWFVCTCLHRVSLKPGQPRNTKGRNT
jgi:hypothetical protein